MWSWPGPSITERVALMKQSAWGSPWKRSVASSPSMVQLQAELIEQAVAARVVLDVVVAHVHAVGERADPAPDHVLGQLVC